MAIAPDVAWVDTLRLLPPTPIFLAPALLRRGFGRPRIALWRIGIAAVTFAFRFVAQPSFAMAPRRSLLFILIAPCKRVPCD